MKTRLFKYPQDGWNDAYALRDKLRKAGFSASVVAPAIVLVRAINETEIARRLEEVGQMQPWGQGPHLIDPNHPSVRRND